MPSAMAKSGLGLNITFAVLADQEGGNLPGCQLQDKLREELAVLRGFCESIPGLP